MAGGHMKYRQLGRDSAHRQALLRNLVTSLIKNEAIHTTWPKAKEAQRLAEKLITHAKKNNEVARRKAQGILYVRLPPPPDTPTINPSPHQPKPPPP
jgi:ribosomal protein L17